jgi:excisionase family DNA binding protein
MGADSPQTAEPEFLQVVSRRINQLVAEYPDIAVQDVDFLFVAYLLEQARFGSFIYGPISIDVAVVEQTFARSYRRASDPLGRAPLDPSARRFLAAVARERARSGHTRVDELHWLLAFMRIAEGLPGRVFGELGVSREEVERFARGDAPPTRGREQLYSPEQVAEYLGVRVDTVRAWIRSGRLPARRLAGQRVLRIKESDVDGLLEPLARPAATDERDPL